MCIICDTLRTDADDGDECVECGAVYQDPPKKIMWVPAPVVASSPTRGQVRAHPRRVSYRSIQMLHHGVGARR